MMFIPNPGWNCARFSGHVSGEPLRAAATTTRPGSGFACLGAGMIQADRFGGLQHQQTP